MRSLFFYLTWCWVATCYALKIVAMEPPVIDAAPFLEPTQEASGQAQEPHETGAFPLPVSSKIQSGKVRAHTAKAQLFSQVIFVVGDDALSRAWLKTKAPILQTMKAIGFATNVGSSQALQELIALAGLPLQPVNADDIASLLGASHYPFVYEKGNVWQ